MSQIKTTEIAGDVAVGRHVVTGGNAKIQGGAIVKRNLKVEGWLDAPNIKGPVKGFFKSEEQLNAAFPLPKRGWWALVGATLPATLWIVERDEQGIDRWVSTGKTAGTPTVEASWCMEAIENLSEELDDVVKPDITQNTSDISGIKTDISAIKAEQKTQNEEIEAIKLETGQNSLELSTLPSKLEEIRLEVRQNSTSISLLPTKQDVKAVSDRAEFGVELAGEAVEGVDTINDMRGKADGFAPLDGTGKVPARHLPGYVDDVVEFGAVVSEVEMLPITLYQSTDAGCMVVYDSDRNVFLLAVSKVAVSGEHIDKWHHEILQPAKPQYTPAAPDDTADPTSPADPAEQSEPAPLSVENEAPAFGTYWQIEGGETILLKRAFTFYGSWGDGETFGTEAEAGGRTPESGKVYSCTSNNKTYRWGARQLVVIGSDLSLGYTANTAFPGDEGSGLATSVGQLNENVDRINERINRGDNRDIKPFDGIWDGTGNAPTSGVWYCPSDAYDGKWCFKSFGETRKFYGYAEEDYNTDETAISGLYRCDKTLYSVDAEGIEPHVTNKDVTESIGKAGGIASLGEDGKLTKTQMPSTGFHNLGRLYHDEGTDEVTKEMAQALMKESGQLEPGDIVTYRDNTGWRTMQYDSHTDVEAWPDVSIRLLDLQWEQAGGSVIVSGETYGLNGINDLSLAEAMEILSYKPLCDSPNLYGGKFSNLTMRTLLPIRSEGWTQDLQNTFLRMEKLEVLQFARDWIAVYKAFNTFSNCNKLREIKGIIGIRLNNGRSECEHIFFGATALEEVRVQTSQSLNLRSPSRLSLTSMQYLVANASNGTKVITITVHPDVYAKLTGDTTNAAAAALTADELAQWQEVLGQAVAKNISFATA